MHLLVGLIHLVTKMIEMVALFNIAMYSCYKRRVVPSIQYDH